MVNHTVPSLLLNPFVQTRVSGFSPWNRVSLNIGSLLYTYNPIPWAPAHSACMNYPPAESFWYVVYPALTTTDILD